MATKKHKLSYKSVLADVVDLLNRARTTSARTVNSVMTSTYWEIGRRIVEYEQGGRRRAGYGERILERLSEDLSARFGRGFSAQNLLNFRSFFLTWPISQTVSGELAKPLALHPSGIRRTAFAELRAGIKRRNHILQTLYAKSATDNVAASISQTVSGELLARSIGLPRFPLPWSHYVRLISVENPEARKVL